jgi:hypothetical protein
MLDPPLADGAVHVTTEEALAFDVAATVVGGPGAPTTSAFELDDAGPAPAALAAVTVNVYVVPVVSEPTVHVSGPVVVQVCPPGDEVTV